MVARFDKTKNQSLLDELLTARRGQAYFSRKLQELTDSQFRDASGLSGWSRAQLVAHVGLNARALTHLTEWARTGVETPMYDSPGQRGEDIDFSATLPVQALRNLSDHAAIHLNVEWRDLSDEEWEHEIRTAQGREVPVRETVWMRTREVWVHAVDLGNGGSFEDFPRDFVDALTADVMRSWDRRRVAENLPVFTLKPIDREPIDSPPSPDNAIILRGTAAALARWASGRGTSGVLTDTGETPLPAPRWL